MSEETKAEEKKEEQKKLEIPPDILLDCVEYTGAVMSGYVAIYENFQKILWTMKNRGVPTGDAASATMTIVNEAARRAQEMVPHRDPFREEEDTDKQAEEIERQQQEENKDE